MGETSSWVCSASRVLALCPLESRAGGNPSSGNEITVNRGQSARACSGEEGAVRQLSAGGREHTLEVWIEPDSLFVFLVDA